MKKTAVEWLIEKFDNVLPLDFNWDKLEKVFKQAKEMEKQQIVDAYRVGKVEATLPPEKLNTGGKYYRELFNQNNMEEDCCPNCGECENIHTNYDWSKKDRPVEEHLCNECGIYFKPE